MSGSTRRTPALRCIDRRGWRWRCSRRAASASPTRARSSRRETDVRPGEELGYFNDPPAPTPGEPPTDIVKHFLDAQAAIPLQTNTAKEFLTSEESRDLAAASAGSSPTTTRRSPTAATR